MKIKPILIEQSKLDLMLRSVLCEKISIEDVKALYPQLTSGMNDAELEMLHETILKRCN